MDYIRLGDLYKISKGKKVEALGEVDKGAIRYIQIDDLRNNNNIKYCLNNEKYVTVNKDDLIIAWDGANAGTIGYGLEGAIGSTLARLRTTNRNLYTPFIGRYMQGQSNVLRDKCTGATIPHIQKSVLEDVKIPKYSFEVQQKIAKTLDKAQEIMDKRKKQIEACDELIKSQFIEMFGNPSSNEKGWNIITIDDATDLVTYGLTVRPEYVEDGIKVISAAEIRGGEVNYNVAKQIAETDYEKLTDKSKPQKNELLFGKAGASIGYCAIIKNDEPFAITQNIARIKVKENLINPYWLMYYLKTDFIQEMCQREAKGNAIKDLQIQIIKGIPLFDCSLESQNQFAQFVQHIDKLKFEMQKSLTELENNFNALMQKAFKGGLF